MSRIELRMRMGEEFHDAVVRTATRRNEIIYWNRFGKIFLNKTCKVRKCKTEAAGTQPRTLFFFLLKSDVHIKARCAYKDASLSK